MLHIINGSLVSARALFAADNGAGNGAPATKTATKTKTKGKTARRTGKAPSATPKTKTARKAGNRGAAALEKAAGVTRLPVENRNKVTVAAEHIATAVTSALRHVKGIGDQQQIAAKGIVDMATADPLVRKWLADASIADFTMAALMERCFPASQRPDNPDEIQKRELADQTRDRKTQMQSAVNIARVIVENQKGKHPAGWNDKAKCWEVPLRCLLPVGASPVDADMKLTTLVPLNGKAIGIRRKTKDKAGDPVTRYENINASAKQMTDHATGKTEAAATRKAGRQSAGGNKLTLTGAVDMLATALATGPLSDDIMRKIKDSGLLVHLWEKHPAEMAGAKEQAKARPEKGKTKDAA